MNIVVRSSVGECFVRPDTTWERDAEDFYPPEFVSRLDYTPVLFAHISKPGRSISEKFASRYFDSIGFGVLLYPGDMLDGTPTAIAKASCLDHTSFLTLQSDTETNNADAASQGRCISSLRLANNGKSIFERTSEESPSDKDIVKAIAETSKYVYLRFGDIVAIELDKIQPLCKREDGVADISIFFNDKNLGEFRIIF